ncbi:MAG: Lrp/AsnC family transcriptional regulator [Candidatus Hermodarchaeota archaeon]
MIDSKPIKIDSKDREIINLLKKDARITHQQIANQVQLARQTVQKRVKALEDNGIIQYSVITNDKKLGKEITAFILLEVDRTRRPVGEFNKEILSRMEELEILELHHVAGQEDMILKIRTRNIDTFEVNLVKITQMDGISRTRTVMCLSSVEQYFQEEEEDRWSW